MGRTDKAGTTYTPERFGEVTERYTADKICLDVVACCGPGKVGAVPTICIPPETRIVFRVSRKYFGSKVSVGRPYGLGFFHRPKGCLRSNTPLLWVWNRCVGSRRGHVILRCLLNIMKLIELTKGYSTQVDDEDYEFLSQFRWHIWESKTTDIKYARRVEYEPVTRHRHHIMMHRQIKGFPDGEVDHHDGDGLNNQRDNLRNATHAQNMANRRREDDNVLKGATWVEERGKWKSRIRGPEGKVLHIAYCDTKEEAHFMYLAMAAVIQGEFMRAE